MQARGCGWPTAPLDTGVGHAGVAVVPRRLWRAQEQAGSRRDRRRSQHGLGFDGVLCSPAQTSPCGASHTKTSSNLHKCADPVPIWPLQPTANTFVYILLII